MAAGGRFATADLYAPALDALGLSESRYTLASFRYDLSQLRAKGLVEKIPHSRRYGLVGKGYAIGVAFLKRFEKIYAPLTAGLAGALWRRWLTGGGQALRARSPVSTHLR